jgi:hypothetical protein
MYGRYALPVTPPERSDCDVCGAPAEFARVDGDHAVRVWCGPGCAEGRRADELRVGEHVALWADRFPEVRSWPDHQAVIGREVWPLRGFAVLAVVAAVGEDGVTLRNPGSAEDEPGDAPEAVVVPADYPCTRFTGITVRRPRRGRRSDHAGHVVWRWPVDAPWARDVSFGHWVSYQPQGTCGDADCEEVATLWVSSGLGSPTPADWASCERCLARRLRRRVHEGATPGAPGQRPSPTPVAFWDGGLGAWDVRPHDGSPTQLA